MIVLENEKTGWLAGHQWDMILSVYDCVLHEEAQIDDYMWLWQMKQEFDGIQIYSRGQEQRHA